MPGLLSLSANLSGFQINFNGQDWTFRNGNQIHFLEAARVEPYELGRLMIEGQRVYRIHSPSELPGCRVLPGFEGRARPLESQSQRLLEELG